MKKFITNNIEEIKSILLVITTSLWLTTLFLLIIIIPITTDLRDYVIELKQELYESNVDRNICNTTKDELERKLEQNN